MPEPHVELRKEVLESISDTAVDIIQTRLGLPVDDLGSKNPIMKRGGSTTEEKQGTGVEVSRSSGRADPELR